MYYTIKRKEKPLKPLYVLGGFITILKKAPLPIAPLWDYLANCIQTSDPEFQTQVTD